MQDITNAVLMAQNGDKEALETVVTYSQGYIYNLALRMLQRPADAEDATQEILIKLITHLGQFRGESEFSTWMYRLATNHLLNMRLRDKNHHTTSFDELTQALEMSLSHYSESTEEVFEKAELIEEVKRNCTLGMLMCLRREERLALILGELLEVSSEDGGYIMDTSPELYRKRLSRARKTLVEFVSHQCGIINPDSPCRCHKHVQNKIVAGLMNPEQLNYAQAHNRESALYALDAEKADLDVMYRTVALIRSHPTYDTTTQYREMIKQLFIDDNPDR